MDAVGRKVENQVQFWSLLGPSFVLLSITVLLFKVSVYWYFPVSALMGIPLCVKWKMKGMIVALCFLFLLSGIGYQNVELDDRYWHVGLALTMAFSFIVLTLSLEEAQGLVNKLQLESQSRLDNFVLLDEKWKTAEQEWAIEKEKSRSEIATLTHEVGRIQEDKQTFYKLAQLAKDELVQVRGQHDLLLQDLLYKKQQIAQLQERLEETEMTVQGFVNSDSEKQIQSLTECLTGLEREKKILMAKLATGETEQKIWQQEKEQLWQELQTCQEREKLCLLDQQRFQQEKGEQQTAFQSLQNKCLVLEQERNHFLQAQTGLQQQLEHMRHLETQHRQSIQLSQHKVQELETKLIAEGQQKESLLLRKKELEEQLLRQEKHNQQREEQYKTSLQQLQEQLKEQKEKIEVQLRQAEEAARMQGHQSAQEELLQARQDVEAKKKALVSVEQKVKDLTSELSQQQILVLETTQQMQKLEELKSQLEQALKQTQEQLSLTKQKQDSKSQHQEEVPVLSNSRRIEAMYSQLKQQFQEKCAILDATRRELFHLNEEVLRRQKEYEEEKIFGQSLNERYLQSYLVQLGKQYERMQWQYQQEIDELSQLIENLLHQLTTNQKRHFKF